MIVASLFANVLFGKRLRTFAFKFTLPSSNPISILSLIFSSLGTGYTAQSGPNNETHQSDAQLKERNGLSSIYFGFAKDQTRFSSCCKFYLNLYV